MAERIKLKNDKYWDSTGIVTNAAGETLDTTLSNLHVELTQAQYDAQPSAQKNNGTVYFITDADAREIPIGFNIADQTYQVNVPSTATSYTCRWANYDILSFNPVQYGNRVSGSVVVPSTWFSETNEYNNVIISVNVPNPTSPTYVQIWQNGNEAVYMKLVAGGSAPTACGVDILGIKLAT